MARGVEIGRGYIAVDVDENGARAALRGFVGFAGGAFATAAASAGVLIGAAAKVGIEFLSMKEQANVAFTTLLGSGEAAQKMLLDLQTFAAATPFEMKGLIDNARQLLGVGVAADKVIPTLTALGNTAGALGIDQDHFNNILLATTQAMGKGKLQGEELMQMVENGIPVWQLLAKATGKTVPQLQEMSSAGQLLAKDVLPKLFDQMQKDYGGAMAAQSKTLAGTWSSLKDNTKILLGEAMKPLFEQTKSVVGVLGELASSDKAVAFAQRFAAGMERGFTAAKTFGSGLKREFGDKAEAALEQARKKATETVDAFGGFAESGLKAASTLVSAALPAVVAFATAGGGVLYAALTAAAKVMEAVERNADKIASGVSTAATVFTAVAGPAVMVLVQALKLAGDVLSLVVDLVGDLSGPLGVLTGVVLAGVLGWRAYNTALTGAQTVMNLLAPSKNMERLSGFAKHVDDVALSAGVMTERVTGSATAGEKLATAGSRAGTMLQRVGSALPLVGVAAVAVGMAFEESANKVEELARKLNDGRLTSKQVQDMTTVADQTSRLSGGMVGSLQSLGRALGLTGDSMEDIKKKAADLNAGMSPVERAQQAVTKATNEYNAAIKDGNTESVAAQLAQRNLAIATQDLEKAQSDAAKAAKDHERSLYDLASQALASADADLQLRQTRLGVKQAEDDLAAALATHGAGSKEVEAAEIALEQSYIRSAAAARDKAVASNADKSASEQAAAGNQAYTQELLTMAAAAGDKAPASLLALIGKLSESELKAYDASNATGEFNRKVITLPDGRTVVLAVDDKGTPIVVAMRSQLDMIRDKTITVTVVTRGDLTYAVDQFGRRTGAMPAKAVGGPVQPGAVKVGENGPETLFLDRKGWVATASQTRQAGAAAEGGGPSIVQQIYAAPGMSEQNVADLAAASIAWRARFL